MTNSARRATPRAHGSSITWPASVLGLQDLRINCHTESCPALLRNYSGVTGLTACICCCTQPSMRSCMMHEDYDGSSAASAARLPDILATAAHLAQSGCPPPS